MKNDNYNDSDIYNFKQIDTLTLSEGTNVLEKILNSDIDILPRKVDKQVVLYGAGSLGKMAKDFFNYLDIPFLYVVDKNADQYKNNRDWTYNDVIYPDEVKEGDKKKCLLIICIVTTPLIALRDELKKSGWEDIVFFYDVCEAYKDIYPLSNGWFLHKLMKDDKDAIKKVFSELNDVSRMHYLQFLAWRKLRVELKFKNTEINLNNRFFIHEIINILHEDEIFIDCGAYVGEVIKKFVGITDGNYKKIYAVEADKNNFAILENNIKYIPNCSFIECALSNKNGKENFYHGFGFASKLSENGNDIVSITTLDSLNIDATFIKIHLEGGELNAIIGAQQTIKKNRPIMAITLYHNSDGIWRIIVLLMNLLENYHYHFRLHSWAGTGAVLYAIPIERNKRKRYNEK